MSLFSLCLVSVTSKKSSKKKSKTPIMISKALAQIKTISNVVFQERTFMRKMSVWYQQSMNTFQQHVEILTTCFHSRRSRSCYDRCALISVHLSRGSKQNASIVSSFILPMFWLLWTNHEAWCKSSQSWVVLLLMSIRTISINTLFLREHMCKKI